MMNQAPPIRALLLAALLGMLLLASGVVYGINLAVDRAVALDAEQKAKDWSDYFIGSTPRLDTLLITGTLDDEQLAGVQIPVLIRAPLVATDSATGPCALRRVEHL